jgi:ABC-type polysaccharide/polyol phosphate transport system ATPase subunit
MGLSLPEIRRRMDEILAFAELESFASLKLKHYSSGMSMRLGYAVAFAAARDILVLDEIFAVGDAGFRLKCEKRFRELRQAGHTILLVSHNPRDVREFCDTCLMVESGKLSILADPAAVVSRYLNALGQV